jgi:hypothetical protein
MFEQVADAVERIGGLLAACERELDTAPWLVVFLSEADHRIREDGRHRLVIRRAARVKVAALFDELEWVAAPVLALGFDHVEMSKQHQRLQTRIRPRQQSDQVALLRVIGRRDEMEVVLLVTGPHEVRLHGVCRRGARADGERGIDLDQFLIERSKCLLAGAPGT